MTEERLRGRRGIEHEGAGDAVALDRTLEEATASLQSARALLALRKLIVAERPDVVLSNVVSTNCLTGGALRGVRDKDTLSILPIEDTGLQQELPSGLPIYRIQEVQLDRGRLNTDALAPKVDTLCTSSGVFARLDADPKFVDKLSDVVALQRESLLPHH